MATLHVLTVSLLRADMIAQWIGAQIIKLLLIASLLGAGVSGFAVAYIATHM